MRPPPASQPPPCDFVAFRSIVGLRRITLEAVDEPGLGGAEGEPVAPGLLQLYEELASAVHRGG